MDSQNIAWSSYLSRSDSNQDGKLILSEFIRDTQQLLPQFGTQRTFDRVLGQTFKRMDTDRNSQLEQSEVESMVSTPSPDLAAYDQAIRQRVVIEEANDYLGRLFATRNLYQHPDLGYSSVDQVLELYRAV